MIKNMIKSKKIIKKIVKKNILLYLKNYILLYLKKKEIGNIYKIAFFFVNNFITCKTIFCIILCIYNIIYHMYIHIIYHLKVYKQVLSKFYRYELVLHL